MCEEAGQHQNESLTDITKHGTVQDREAKCDQESWVELAVARAAKSGDQFLNRSQPFVVGQCNRDVRVMTRASGWNGLDQNFLRGLLDPGGQVLQLSSRHPTYYNIGMAKLSKAYNGIRHHAA